MPERSFQREDLTTWPSTITGKLGDIQIHHPPGTFAPTPASLVTVQAISWHGELLSGTGVDWGTGSGCLAIVAAKLHQVSGVIGLEICQANVLIAERNAQLNQVAHKLKFLVSDSFSPRSQHGRRLLTKQIGQLQFLIANPPASDGDDGFGYRRMVLDHATPYLAPGAVVFLNISLQYGPVRVAQLTQKQPQYVHRGVLASTDWVGFDLDRPDLLRCLRQYARYEAMHGDQYLFGHPEAPGTKWLTARSALSLFSTTGQHPLTKWETHLFIHSGVDRPRL
jgi:methylase of polypeptide subunit release factors